MATWEELSVDSLAAARKLVREMHWRSAVSRSYYAAYAALTADLAGVVTFPQGRNNPSHSDLHNLIESNLPGFSRQTRRNLKSAIRRLYAARTSADYLPARLIDRHSALNSVRDAEYVLGIMRTDHG